MRTPQEHPAVAPWTRRLLLRKRGVFAAAVGIVAVVIAAVWMHAGARRSALLAIADRRFVPLVSTMIPGLRPVTSQVLVIGTITARHDLPIGDGGQAGRIVKVYVQVGDHVKRGEVLARLDDSVLTPQVEELAASLSKARAQAALSAADERRAIAIGPDGGLSAQDIEKSRATAAMDAANVQMVSAQLRQKRAQLALTRVLSPASGIVLTRDAEVGQIASPGGAALFTLEDDSQVELRGQVAEQDLASLKIGQPAEVHLIGYRHSFAGSIWLLGATINPQTRLGEVRIALQPSAALRPGSFARAVITESHAERPVVPQTAVMASSGGSYLYIVNHDGRVARRSVVLGGVISSGVVIESGLTGTERVVTLAGGFLQNGEAVRVAPTRTRGS